MLLELAPEAIPRFQAFLQKLDKELGEKQYIVFEGRRLKAVQEAYYAQGRKSLIEVNRMRKAAGLYQLRSKKDNYKITWTLKSKHLDGLAMDVLPVNGAGNPTWDLAHFYEFFLQIRDCGEKVGLECGADWKAPETDWPHYQVKGEV